MGTEDPLTGLLSPGPSLETEGDDDEDFVASEASEGSAADSDDDDDSSSSDSGGSSSEEGQGGSDADSERSPEVDEDTRQALRATLAQYQQDDDVVFEEEILSDSEISKQFPEEDDLEALRELESDAEGPEETGEEEGEQQDEQEGGEEGEEEGPSAVPGAAAAGAVTAARATQLGPRGRLAPGKQPAPEAMEVDGGPQAQPQPPGPEHLLQQASEAAAQPAPAAPALPAGSQAPAVPQLLSQKQQQQQGLASTAPAAATAVGGWAGELPTSGEGGDDMLAFGAVLGSLEGGAQDAIARRTRAHHPLNEFTLEELEQMLQVDDELEDLGDAGNAEYQRFLQSLRALPDLPDYALQGAESEEEEDEDFAVELAGLLASESEDEKENQGQKQKKRKRGPRKPRASRQRWVRTPEVRPLESVMALRERRLRPLVPKGELGATALAAGGAPPTFGPLAAALSELALVATQNGGGAAAAAAAAAGAAPAPAGRSPVVWRPPLETTMTAPWPAGAPKQGAQHERQQGQGQARWPSRGGALNAAPHAFQPPQYRQLHRLLHQHVQLLVQVYTMAAASEGVQDRRVAQQAARLLRELHAFSERQTSTRRAAGIPAYDLDQLGLQPAPGPAGLLPALPGGAGWAPPRPATDVYSIADLALLRMVPGLLEALPAPVPAQGVGGEAGQGAGASVGVAVAELSPPDGGLSAASQQQGPAGAGGRASQLAAAAAVAELAARVGATSEGTQAPPERTSGPGQGTEGLAPIWQVENEEQERRRKQTRRARRKPKEHKLWQSLPQQAQQAVGALVPLFDPGVVPQPPSFLPSAQTLFTPTEDELLALGMKRHGYDWQRIRAELLPTKTEAQLFNRKKNRTATTAPDNCIKEVHQLIHGPLQLDEIVLLERAIVFYGRQAFRWELICRNHLPHRQPSTLANLWSQHTNGASVRKKGSKHKAAAAAKAAAVAQGMRCVFLSNDATAASHPAAAPQEQQQQGVQQPLPGPAPAAVQPPLPQPGPVVADEGGGEGEIWEPCLLPRRSLNAVGRLHALLHRLFPPGMEVPLPLQLAAAVHACASAAGAALPGPLLALLPPGAAPPVGMVPLGLIDGPALPAWRQVVAAAQPVALPQPPPQRRQHQQQLQQPGARAGEPIGQAAARDVRQRARPRENLPGGHGDSGPHALTVHSPTRDVASELQRLLAGEDSGGAERLLLAASPAGQGRRRRRRGERWKSLFGGEEGGEEQREGQQQQTGPGGQQFDAGAGGWSQDSWGFGGDDDPYLPLALAGLPPAPPVAGAGAAAAGAAAGRGGVALPSPEGPSRAARRALGGPHVAGKGPPKRVHFEFDREELEDSDGEEGAAWAPVSGAHALQHALQHTSDQEGLQRSPPLLPAPGGTAAPAAAVPESAAMPEQGAAEGAPAEPPAAAGVATRRRGQRRPAPTKPIHRTRKKRSSGAEKDASGPGLAIQQQQQQQQQQLAPQWQLPEDAAPGPAGQSGGPQLPAPTSTAQTRPAATARQMQQPRPAAGQQTQPQASGGVQTRSGGAGGARPPRAPQPSSSLGQSQRAEPPVFEQEELLDSDGEGGAQASPKGASPGASPSTDAVQAVQARRSHPAAAAVAARPAGAVPQQNAAAQPPREPAAVSPAAAAARGAASPGGQASEPDQPTHTRKSRRVAAQRASVQITAWVSGDSSGADGKAASAAAIPAEATAAAAAVAADAKRSAPAVRGKAASGAAPKGGGRAATPVGSSPFKPMTSKGRGNAAQAAVAETEPPAAAVPANAGATHAIEVARAAAPAGQAANESEQAAEPAAVPLSPEQPAEHLAEEPAVAIGQQHTQQEQGTLAGPGKQRQQQQGEALAAPVAPPPPPQQQPGAAPAGPQQQQQLGEPEKQQQMEEQQPEQRLGEGGAPGGTWAKEEDRMLLKAVLAVKGKLSVQQLQELAAQVGGEAAGRTIAAVEQRCACLLDRFTQLAQQRKQQKQQQQQQT